MNEIWSVVAFVDGGAAKGHNLRFRSLYNVIIQASAISNY